MADDSEIAITIVSDEESNVETATTQVEKTEPKVQVETKDPALVDLMAQYKDLEAKSAEAEKRREEAESRRIAAEKEAAKHRTEAESARKAQTSSHLDTITTAISGSEQEVESAKSAIRSAKASGDVEAEIEAQDRLAKARATLIRLDEAKQDIEARIKAPPPKREAPADPVEAFAQSRTEPTANWIRQHPEYVRTEKGLRRLTAADAVAQDEGMIPDTPEYFARVEEYLGIRKGPEKAAPTEAAQVQAKTRAAAPPVAPGAAVSANGGGQVNQNAVTLTKREASAAQDGTIVWNWNDPNGKFKKGDPIGLQEMARRKMSMTKQGLYDRAYSEG